MRDRTAASSGHRPALGAGRPFLLLAAGLTASSLAAGCAAKPVAQVSREDLEKSVTYTTAPGNGQLERLTWALAGGEPTSLDPALIGDYPGSTVEANLCEGLVRMTADFKIEPGLAEKITRPDDRTIVYDLRPGVTFTNGDPLTPEDVVYSLERHTQDKKLGSFWSSTYDGVTSIKKTGPMQVTVQFSKPSVLFEESMATPPGVISQKAYVEKAGATYGTPKGGVMCTGPFALEKWAPGEQITLTRNDNYWDKTRLAKAKQVDFKFINDSSTLTSALLAGEVDGMYESPSTSYSVLANSGSGKLYLGPSTQMVELLPAQETGPMADPRVRQALDLAIDKTALVANVYGPAAEPLNTMIPPGMWGTGPTRTVFEEAYGKLQDTSKPDLEKAKSLVAEADPANRSFVAAMPAGDQTALQILTFVQAAAKEIGLTMTIRQIQPTEFSDLFYNADRRKEVDLVYAVGYSEIANPISYPDNYVRADGLFNWTGYDDPEVRRLMDEGLHTADVSTSAELFVKAQALYTPERLVIPLAGPYEQLYMNNRISGAPVSFAYLQMPWAAMIGAV
ncbi:ABC transporter substrate-binding protein [Microtetraspora sp. NBRC 16547]|uniref:ABC transporter substrate-binding protein n=1 Tax=Microtetraspora sp. NBRC 16547 TaxID=3030993 RepID=UPI00249FDDC4|nr:ABC transporter substrate-binding protein [Microtetraspora sp. NBRC 16547]GLW96762.1 diguanylate cyclase [Microtetraspora sp. NBRC 16547]